MSSINLLINGYILSPLASIISTVILIIWFWRLYHDSRDETAEKLREIQRMRCGSHSTMSVGTTTTRNATKISSNVSSTNIESKTDMNSHSDSPPISHDLGHDEASSDITKQSDKSRKGSLAKLQGIEKWLASLSFICGFVFCWSTICYVIIVDMSEMTEIENCIFHSSTLMVAIWQRFTLYTYFMIRTYLIFRGSVHDISYKRIKCYSITLFILFFIGVSLYLLTAFSTGCQSETNPFILIPSFFLFLLEMAFSFFCLKLSVNRLVKLYQTSKNSMENKDEIVRKHLEKLMAVSTKITVLTLAAIISTSVNIFFFVPSGWDSGTALDTTFNTMCLLLSFIVFDEQYKLLCKCCDICMLKCCQNHTRCVKYCCCVCNN